MPFNFLHKDNKDTKRLEVFNSFCKNGQSLSTSVGSSNSCSPNKTNICGYYNAIYFNNNNLNFQRNLNQKFTQGQINYFPKSFSN